jgi:hypothetical protein
MITGKSTLGALAIGLVFAPLTGGSSLVYTAVTLATWSAVDVATKNQSVDK